MPLLPKEPTRPKTSLSDFNFIVYGMLAEAGDYLSGCKQVTVAPAFSVDATDSVTYGGGVFAGCEENGRLAEFHCDATLDTTTGKTKMTCAPLSLWKREKSKK